jgi:hypothetical protein
MAFSALAVARSIALRLIRALRKLAKRGNLLRKGKYKAALIWELPPEKTLV